MAIPQHLVVPGVAQLVEDDGSRGRLPWVWSLLLLLLLPLVLLISRRLCTLCSFGHGYFVNASDVWWSPSAGIAAKVFETLGQGGINIEMISTSEIKISVVVEADKGEAATQQLHDTFFPPEN